MRRTALLPLLPLLVLACKKAPPPPPPPAPAPAPAPAPPPAPPAVAAVALGGAIGADKKVTAAKEAFGVKDKVYASIETTGAGHVKLRALWSFVKGDKAAKVNETTMEFDAAGPAINEFHIENSKDWPKGDYKVEIFLGDAAAPAMSKNFKIQ